MNFGELSLKLLLVTQIQLKLYSVESMFTRHMRVHERVHRQQEFNPDELGSLLCTIY